MTGPTAAQAMGSLEFLSHVQIPEEGRASNPEVDRLVEEMVKRLYVRARLRQVRLRYEIHEGTGRIMVKVLDADTEEVIKEIPLEDMLDTLAKIMKFVGVLLDRKA